MLDHELWKPHRPRSHRPLTRMVAGVVGAGGEGLDPGGPAIRNLPSAERANPGSCAGGFTLQPGASPRRSGITSAGG
jgi:hypothetical protein